MRRISSQQTFFLKRVFPAIWFGALGAICVGMLAEFASGRFQAPAFILLPPIAMIVFGYLIFRNLVFDLADLVIDAGDSLLVTRGKETVRVALTEIVNVDASPFSGPPRIVLTLRTPAGRKIAFAPKRPFTLNPFASIPIADELVERVERARRDRQA